MACANSSIEPFHGHVNASHERQKVERLSASLVKGGREWDWKMLLLLVIVVDCFQERTSVTDFVSTAGVTLSRSVPVYVCGFYCLPSSPSRHDMLVFRALNPLLRLVSNPIRFHSVGT